MPSPRSRFTGLNCNCINMSWDSNIRCLHLRHCLSLGAYRLGCEVDLQRFPLPRRRHRRQPQLLRIVSEQTASDRELRTSDISNRYVVHMDYNAWHMVFTKGRYWMMIVGFVACSGFQLTPPRVGYYGTLTEKLTTRVWWHFIIKDTHQLCDDTTKSWSVF